MESLLSKEELSNPGYETFQFIYLMATPDSKNFFFALPQEVIDGYADRFDYTEQAGNMPLVPQMIEKAHDARVKILLCFGGQQEFRPFLEKPERISKFVGYMVRLVGNNDYDGIDIDWEITLERSCTPA